MRDIDRIMIEGFIENLNKGDLVDLNRLIVDRIRILDQIKTSENMSGFYRGAWVIFRKTDGSKVFGRIEKLNKKTISMLTNEGHRYNVPPELLRNLE